MTGSAVRRTAGAALAALLGLVLAIPLSAGAQDVSIEIPLDTVVRGPEGSEHLLAAEAVPGDLSGVECRVAAVSSNQESVHPDNDLIIASGDDELILEDVEGDPFEERSLEGALTLGDEVTVTLSMGPDEVFSAGMVVEVGCPAAETTTTTEPTSTTTTETTVPDTTTTTSVTTTTVAETTTSTVGETTTTEILGTTTSSEATTTTTGDTSTTDSTLPFTGIGGGPLAGIAASALAAGGVLLIVGRHSGPYSDVRTVTVEGVRVTLLRR